MATLNFNLVKRKNPYIRATVSHDGMRKDVFVASWEGYWDKKKQRSGNAPIDNKIALFEARFNDYIMRNKDVSLENCILAIKGEAIKTGTFFFTDMVKSYIEDQKNDLQSLTLLKYSCLQTAIEEYEKFSKKRLRVEDINKKFYKDYIDYLINEKNNTNKTINRKIKYVKTVMQFAYDEKVINHFDWKVDVALKDVSAARYPLLPEEEEKLWGYKTNDIFVRRVVDAFLFCIYSGLRFMDLKILSASHVFTESFNGEDITYINMTATKGLSNQTITVLKKGDQILNKYLKNTGKVFYINNNCKSNKTIKDVFKELGIDRKIEKITRKGSLIIREEVPMHNLASFHIARYTYLDRQLSSGVPVVDAQHNMNHSKMATTQGYARDNTIRRIYETRRIVG